MSENATGSGRGWLLLAVLCPLVVAGGAGAWWLTREGCRSSWRAHTGPVRALALTRDGTVLASAGTDRTVRLWSPTGRSMGELSGHEAAVTAIAFRPDGQQLASAGSDGTLKLWDVAGQREVQSWKGHREGVAALVFLADGKTLVSAGNDRVLHLWQDGQERGVLRGHTGRVNALALSPDGQWLASGGSGDRVIRVWHPDESETPRLLRGTGKRVQALAFIDGRKLVAANRDGEVEVLNVETGQQEGLASGTERVVALASLPEGRGVVGGAEEGAVLRWPLPLTTGSPARRGQRSILHALVLTPDGKGAFTGGADGRIRLWDVP